VKSPEDVKKSDPVALGRHDRIMSLSHEDGKIAYDERYCHFKGGVCQRNGVLAFWDWNRTKFELDDDLIATLNDPYVPNVHNANEPFVVLRNSAADYSYGGDGATVAGSGKMMLSYELGVHLHDKPRLDPHAEQLEIDFVDAVEGWKSDYFDAWPDNRALRDLNSDAAISSDQIVINLCLLFVFAYTCSTMANRRDHAKSHAFLGSMAVWTTLMAIFAGYGVVVAFGVVFNPSTMIAIFLVLGIGIDDAFVIYGAYDHVDRSRHASVEAAVIRAVEVAGSSITVTSVTDFCAFIAGSFITIPALSSFCIFSAVAVMMDFFFQITAFVAWMTLDLKKAEERGGKDCCCACCCCCPGAKVAAVAPAAKAGDDDKAVEAVGGPAAPDGAAPGASSGPANFWGTTYADAILSKPGKAGVLLTAAALVVLGVVGCTRFTMDFDVEWFLTRSGEYGFVFEALEIRDDYFSHRTLLPVRVFTKEPSVGYFEQKDELASLIDGLYGEGGNSKAYMPYNWFTQHELYDACAPPYDVFCPYGGGPSNTSAAWYASLHAFLAGPGAAYEDDVLFADDGRITSSAIPIYWKFVDDETTASAGVRRMVDQRELADDRAPGFDPIVFMELFVFFEGLYVVVVETVTSLLFAAAAVFVVLVLMLANFQLAFLILSVCGAISVCLLGSIYWYGDNLNNVAAGVPRRRRCSRDFNDEKSSRSVGHGVLHHHRRRAERRLQRAHRPHVRARPRRDARRPRARGAPPDGRQRLQGRHLDVLRDLHHGLCKILHLLVLLQVPRVHHRLRPVLRHGRHARDALARRAHGAPRDGARGSRLTRR